MFKTSEDVAFTEVGGHLTFKEVDGHLILVNLTTGFYYSLNDTATFVFHLIRQGKKPPEILRELGERYDVPEEIARRDLQECINTLVKERLLVETRE